MLLWTKGLAVALLVAVAPVRTTAAKNEPQTPIVIPKVDPNNPNQIANLPYEKAAARDNLEAQFSLGVVYHLGKGRQRCPKTARKWYEKPAEKAAEPARISAAKRLGFVSLSVDPRSFVVSRSRFMTMLSG